MIKVVGQGFLSDDDGDLCSMGIGKSSLFKCAKIAIADKPFGLNHFQGEVDKRRMLRIGGVSPAVVPDSAI